MKKSEKRESLLLQLLKEMAQGEVLDSIIQGLQQELGEDAPTADAVQRYLQRPDDTVSLDVCHIRLGVVSFEDEQMDDEQDEEALNFQSNWEMVNAYQEVRFILCDDDATWTEQEEAVQTLEWLWESGFTAAAHQLSKCWRDGLGVYPDNEKAELWFRRSAEAGNGFSQYALGKLLQSERRMEEAVSWYEKAAVHCLQRISSSI